MGATASPFIFNDAIISLAQSLTEALKSARERPEASDVSSVSCAFATLQLRQGFRQIVSTGRAELHRF